MKLAQDSTINKLISCIRDFCGNYWNRKIEDEMTENEYLGWECSNRMIAMSWNYGMRSLEISQVVEPMKLI